MEKKKIARRLYIISLSLIFLLAAGLIVRELYSYNRDRKYYANLQANKPSLTYIEEEDETKEPIKEETEPETEEETKGIQLTAKEEELISMNSDYKFWISIKDTTVDYPVVQGDDNEYYLDHTFDGEKRKAGTIYIDYRNDIMEDNNIVIYGHYLRDRTMFSDIVKYKNDEEFFNDESKYISIFLGNDEYKFEVFSAYPMRAKDIVIPLRFDSNVSYLRYIEGLEELSYHNKDMEFDADKTMITLVTCSYEWKDTRTLIHAFPVD